MESTTTENLEFGSAVINRFHTLDQLLESAVKMVKLKGSHEFQMAGFLAYCEELQRILKIALLENGFLASKIDQLRDEYEKKLQEYEKKLSHMSQTMNRRIVKLHTKCHRVEEKSRAVVKWSTKDASTCTVPNAGEWSEDWMYSKLTSDYDTLAFLETPSLNLDVMLRFNTMLVSFLEDESREQLYLPVVGPEERAELSKLASAYKIRCRFGRETKLASVTLIKVRQSCLPAQGEVDSILTRYVSAGDSRSMRSQCSVKKADVKVKAEVISLVGADDSHQQTMDASMAFTPPGKVDQSSESTPNTSSAIALKLVPKISLIPATPVRVPLAMASPRPAATRVPSDQLSDLQPLDVASLQSPLANHPLLSPQMPLASTPKETANNILAVLKSKIAFSSMAQRSSPLYCKESVSPLPKDSSTSASESSKLFNFPTSSPQQKHHHQQQKQPQQQQPQKQQQLKLQQTPQQQQQRQHRSQQQQPKQQQQQQSQRLPHKHRLPRKSHQKEIIAVSSDSEVGGETLSSDEEPLPKRRSCTEGGQSSAIKRPHDSKKDHSSDSDSTL